MNFKEVFNNLVDQTVYVKDAEDEHLLAEYTVPYIKEEEKSTPFDDLLVTYIQKDSDNITTIFVLTDN